jgi:hypothetical protein
MTEQDIFPNTTDGLASPYQRTGLTGVGFGVTICTAGLLILDVFPSRPYRPWSTFEYATAQDPARSPARSIAERGGEREPPPPSFVGPLGVARSHAERSSLLNQDYRPAPEEQGVGDVPDEVL